MSDTVNDTRHLDVLKDLRTIRDTMPQIWEMILQSGACPHLLSVPCVCDPAISCRDCWTSLLNRGLAFPLVSADGRYTCPYCKKPLSFVKVVKHRQIWQCSGCHRKLAVSFSSDALAGTLLPVKDAVDKKEESKE